MIVNGVLTHKQDIMTHISKDHEMLNGTADNPTRM
jgi:hypothetical protein